MQSGVEKLLAWLGMEAATWDLSTQLGAFDHSATATLIYLDTHVIQGWNIAGMAGDVTRNLRH